jgi:hypothetical protein
MDKGSVGIVATGAGFLDPPKGAAIEGNRGITCRIDGSSFADNDLRVTTLASGRDITLRSGTHAGDALLQRTVSPVGGMFVPCLQMQTSARRVPVRTQRP